MLIHLTMSANYMDEFIIGFFTWDDPVRINLMRLMFIEMKIFLFLVFSGFK